MFVERINEIQSVYWTEAINLWFESHQSDLLSSNGDMLCPLEETQQPLAPNSQLFSDKADLADSHWNWDLKAKQLGTAFYPLLQQHLPKLLACLVAS